MALMRLAVLTKPPAIPVSLLWLATILELVSFLYLSLLIFSGYLIARFLREKQLLAKLGNCTVGAFFMGFAAKLAIFSN